VRPRLAHRSDNAKGMLDFQSIEWTAAACFVAFQGSLVLLTGLTLVSGFTDGFYKMEPHTKKISSRPYETSLGTHLLVWGFAMFGPLLAGGAQIMCILQLIPMLVCTYYHYVAGGTQAMIPNCVFMAALAYFGFMPVPPTLPSSIEWTPAEIFLTVVTILAAVACLQFLTGKTDDLYKLNPPFKEIMTRHDELQMGGCLCGMVAGNAAAIIAGGPQDQCILVLLGITTVTIDHFMRGATQNAIVNCIFCLAYAYFGFIR